MEGKVNDCRCYTFSPYQGTPNGNGQATYGLNLYQGTRQVSEDKPDTCLILELSPQVPQDRVEKKDM